MGIPYTEVEYGSIFTPSGFNTVVWSRIEEMVLLRFD